MREMGWTYEELYETPSFVVERALSFMSIEAAEQERQKKRSKNKKGR